MKQKTKNKLADGVFKFVKKNMAKKPFVSVIVAAGGTSNRMGNVNKLLEEVSGVPVIAITLSALNEAKCVNEIILTANENDIVEFADICKKYNFEKVKQIVKGGSVRLESVYRGMAEVSPEAEIIAIHDGARPFVTEDIIQRTVDGAVEYGAAAPCVPVKDTIKVAKSGFVAETPDRSTLFAIQTPQTFDAALIKAAIFNAVENEIEVTDDCSTVEAIGATVKLVEGSYDNMKITVPQDLEIAEAIYNSEGKV